MPTKRLSPGDIKATVSKRRKLRRRHATGDTHSHQGCCAEQSAGLCAGEQPARGKCAVDDSGARKSTLTSAQPTTPARSPAPSDQPIYARVMRNSPGVDDGYVAHRPYENRPPVRTSSNFVARLMPKVVALPLPF